MQEALKHSLTGLNMHEDPAAIVAAIEAQSTRHETPCANGHMVWRRWGAGPAVVLVHGGGGAWSHWIRNVVPLSAYHTVWALDMPGFGESATPEPRTIEAIAQVVERGLHALIPGDEPINLVGFSFGSSIATMLAARLKNRAHNLVLAGARFSVEQKRLHAPVAEWKKLDDPAARLDVHRKNLQSLMIADPNNIDALAIHLQATNTRRARISRQRLNPGPNEKMHEYLPQVRVRGRVTGISGEYDQGAKQIMDQQEAALKAIQPDAGFHIIKKTGHWVQYEAAERFNQLLLAALGRGAS